MSVPTEPSEPRAARRSRWGWLAGVLTVVLLAGVGVLLDVPSAANPLPDTPATAFLPADATHGKVTLTVGGVDVPAELSDARLAGASVPYTVSPTAWDAVSARNREPSGAPWFREAVTPTDSRVPVRYRWRTVDDRGVWLVVQDWAELGLVLDGYLELPADAAPGRSWTSSGTARGRPADGDLRFTNASSAATPDDASRAAEGCVSVSSRTQLTGRVSTTWTETELWCPDKGVVAGSGTQQDVSYAVTSGGDATPVADADLATPAWDVSGLASWRLRTRRVLAGDPTFGLVDATAATVQPGRAPVVTATGTPVFPTLEGGDLAGLVPRGDDLWAHWWVRPGGQVTALAAVGSLVVAPTTAHRVSAYRAGRTLAWNALLDDVAVAPPLPVGDGVAVATVSGRLSLLDQRTGAVRWSVPVGGGVHTALAAGAGVVVTADTGSSVTAWDVATGEQRWQVDDAASPYSTTLLVSGDTVVVAANGTLTAYAAATGTRVWVQSPGLALDSATTVGDQVWLSVGDDLQARSVADGDPRWTLAGAQPVTTSASGCATAPGTTLGLARRGDQLLAVDGTGGVRASWTLPALGGDVLTATCRGAGVDLVAYDPDGARPLVALRLETP